MEDLKFISHPGQNEVKLKELGVSIVGYLDKRRAKENAEIYPIYIRIVHKRKYKILSTGVSVTQEEFNKFYSTRLDSTLSNKKAKAFDKLTRVHDVIVNMGVFTFENFNIRYGRKNIGKVTVSEYYDEYISDIEARRHNTKTSYEDSKKSLLAFHNSINKGKDLYFEDVTPKWLKAYEEYMVYTKERSKATVGIYLRSFRAVINRAIFNNDVNAPVYPFSFDGKDSTKYVIPSSSKVKKALNAQQMKTLFNAETKNEFEQTAKEYFFFSYACSGMNMKDICIIRFKDIIDGKFEYKRAKTKSTSRKGSSIVVHLNSYALDFIERRGIKSTDKNSFVFDIVSPNMNHEERSKRIKNFTRSVNQNLKRIAKREKLPEEISTYWGRHTYATLSIKRGASMEFIQESLGHSNLKTTQNYFDGFDNEEKKKFSEDLMNF